MRMLRIVNAWEQDYIANGETHKVIIGPTARTSFTSTCTYPPKHFGVGRSRRKHCMTLSVRSIEFTFKQRSCSVLQQT